MLVNFLYMEVLLFSNQKVPYKACKVSKPTSYKNAQHQNQLRCLSTEVPVLFVSINVFGWFDVGEWRGGYVLQSVVVHRVFSSTNLHYLALVLTLSHQMWPGLSLPFHSEIQFYTRTPILWFSGCLDHLFKFACSGLQVFILHSKKYKKTDLLKSQPLS